MNKDLTDVCNYLKGLVIPHTPDDFVVAESFRHGLTDNELRKGIAAFRSFLYEFFDQVASDKNRIDVEKGKKYNPGSGEDSIVKCFPIIYDIAVILATLGCHGKLETEPRMKLTVNGGDMLTPLSPTKPPAINKISNKRKSEMFDYLSDMGFYFEDLNVSQGIDFTKTGTFYVTYEKDDYLLLGIKLIAEAKDNSKAAFQKFMSMFMRGDFYPLANQEAGKHTANASEYANGQPPEIRDWIIDIEKLLINNGCKISSFYLSNSNGEGSFGYVSHKGKTICRITMGITGSAIEIRGHHFGNKENILSELPESMLNVVKNVSGCGGCEARNPDTFVKCRHGGAWKFTLEGKEYECCVFGGFIFPLNIAEERELIRRWVELEIGL